MDRKISEQKRLIENLYDDLESREKFIEKLEDDLKETIRRNAKNKKQLELEKKLIEEELEKKTKVIDELKDKNNFKCPNGCNMYSKSVDDIYEA